MSYTVVTPKLVSIDSVMSEMDISAKIAKSKIFAIKILPCMYFFVQGSKKENNKEITMLVGCLNLILILIFVCINVEANSRVKSYASVVNQSAYIPFMSVLLVSSLLHHAGNY